MTSSGEPSVRMPPGPGPVGPSEIPNGRGRTYARLWTMQYLAGAAIGVAMYGMIIHADAFAGLVEGSVVLLAIAFSLTFLAFTPSAAIAGRLVERWGAQRIVLASNLAYLALTVIALAVLAAGFVPPWLAIALLMGRTGSQAVQIVSLDATVPLLFQRQDLTRANGPRLIFTASVAGFEVLIAFVLYQIIGAAALVAISCIVVTAAILEVLRADISPRRLGSCDDSNPQAGHQATLLAQLRHRPELVAVLAAYALFNFVLGFGEVASRTIAQSLGSEATVSVVLGFGFLGMLGATILITLRGIPGGHIRGLRISFVIMGASLVLAAARPNLVLVIASVAVFLTATPFIMAMLSTLLHANIEPHLMGRMMGLKTVMIGVFYGGGNVIAVLSSAISRPLAGGNQVSGGFLSFLVGTGDAEARGYALMTMVLGLAILAGAFAVRRHNALEGLVDPGNPVDEPANIDQPISSSTSSHG